MNYLKYNTIVAATFLGLGALNVLFRPPVDMLTVVVILFLMFGAFYTASIFGLKDELAFSNLGVALSVFSSLAFSLCVATLSIVMFASVHGS